MSTAAVSSSSIFQELQTFYQDRKTDLQQLGQALQSGDLTGAQTAYSALTALGQSGPFSNSEPFRNSQREQDFTAIGQALQSGDLAGAQQAFATLESTFRKQPVTSPAPVPTGPVDNPIIINIGYSGTNPPGYANPLAATPATTSSASGTSTLPAITSTVGTTSTSATTSTAASTSGKNNSVPPEIVLNLGSGSTGGAQPEIILNLGNTGSTGSGSPEEITINLSNNGSGSDEQLTIGVNDGQVGQTEQIAINFNNNANEQIVLNLFNTAASEQSQGNSVSIQA